MDNSLQEDQPHGQINPGQTDPSGKEVTIRKDEGISDQGNEWNDEEGGYAGGGSVLGEKAEKYIKESANIEGLPDEEDEKNERMEEVNKERNSKVTDDQKEEDDVIESKEDFVPGYDLGRNKIQ